METIADRINKFLSAKGLKKRDLAKTLRISDASVSTMCSGKTKPSGQTITMICEKFNVREEWLREGKGEMFEPDDGSVLLGSILEGRTISNREKALVLSFLELPKESRDAVLEFVESCVRELSTQSGEPSDQDLASKVAELERKNRELQERLEALEKEDGEDSKSAG